MATNDIYCLVVKNNLARSQYEVRGTLDELRKRFQSTLDLGATFTGPNKRKVKLKPTTIKSLITNLNNAKRNASRIKDLPTVSFYLKT